MDHQKPTILLIFGTLSLGGCGGHPMRPKLNLKDKSQMSTPNEYTDNLKSNLICIFLSVRTKSKKPLCPRTQCRILLLNSFWHQIIGVNDQNINLNFCTKFHLSLGIQIRHVLKPFFYIVTIIFFGISHSVSSLNHNIPSLKRITKQDLVVPQNHLE